MKTKEELKLVKKLIKLVEKNWTKDKCKGYLPGCPNCEGQVLLGYLESYRQVLEWEVEEHECK